MIGDIHKLVAAQPFVPFTIYSADGNQVRVPSVDHIAVSPTGGRVFVFKDDDSWTIISGLLMTRLEVDHSPSRAQAA